MTEYKKEPANNDCYFIYLFLIYFPQRSVVLTLKLNWKVLMIAEILQRTKILN